MMIKVLIVNTVRTELNGITGVILNYLKAMPKDNLTIDFVSINKIDSKLEDVILANIQKLYVIERKISKVIEYVSKLSEICRGYDIIHVHGNSATMTLEMLAAKLGHVPVRISHSHSTSCTMVLLDKLLRPIFYELCNGHLACGKQAGVWLFKEQDFVVLNNGIDTGKFQFNEKRRNELRNQLKLQDCAVIGHVGNFDVSKNHHFIFEVFKHLRASNNKVKLMLLGDGVKRDEYLKQVSDLGIADKVMFMGSVDNPQDYMCAMDLVLMPSHFEGFPLTLIEEQANGLRCVVSDVITKDVNISGNVHFLSLKHNSAKWADYISKLLAELVDRTEMSKLAISSIEKAGYSIEVLAKQLEEYYIEQISISK